MLLPASPKADPVRAGGDRASVTTDKPDYSPGEEAVITASGFRPGDTVTFAIADDPKDPGDDGDADTYAPFSVTDGGAGDLDGKVNGTVVTRWRIPTDNNGSGRGTPDALNASLQLTATGTDGKVATTTFTDAASITLTGVSVTHDETAELQNSLLSSGFPEDANDNDTSLALPTAFGTRLAALNAGTPIGKALSGFDGTNDGLDLIEIGSGTLVPSLVFVLGGAGDGVDSGLRTLAGLPVYLYTDSSDKHIVLGRTASADGPVVVAFYLNESKDIGGNIIGAKVWSVQYQPLQHTDPANADDPLTLAPNVLKVGGAVSVVPFSLAGAPSGQNLFLTIGTPDVAIVATGKKPANQDVTGTIVGGDTVNTSQAAGTTTIGVNNQMIDPTIKKGVVTTQNEGLYLTYVTGVNPDYTVGTSAASLTQTEADVEANIQFTGLFAARTASFAVVQLQGGTSAVIRLAASNVNNAENITGVNYIGQAGLNGAESIPITSVTVLDASGNPVISGVNINISGGVAVISGVKAGYRIRYTTDASGTPGIETHNRLLIENAGSGSGKNSASFDVGSIQLETVNQLPPIDISEKLRFEDDGPTTTTAIDTLQLDEDDLLASRGTGESGGNDNSDPDLLSVSGSITDNVSWGADGFGSVSKVVIGTGTDAVELAMPQTSGADSVMVYFNSAGARQEAVAGAAASLVVNEDGSYVFSLLDNLLVSGPAENIAKLLNDAGVVVYGVDGDGDEIAGGVTIKMNVVDDIPAAFDIGNIVGFSKPATPQVGQWISVPGADGVDDIAIVALDQNGTVSDGIQFKITYYDGTSAYATVSGFAETGPRTNIWKGTLTGDFDKNASTDPTAVDFTLTLLANGTYTVQLASPIESISIISTAAGRLSPGGPDISQTLAYTGTTASINFFGVQGSISAAQALDASKSGISDYTEAEIEALSAPGSGGNTTGGAGSGGNGTYPFINAGTEMNVSTSGIGVENNNFDGSGAGAQSTDESFIVNPDFVFKSFSVVIDNSLGGYNASSETLSYRIIYVDGSTSGDLVKVLASDLVAGPGGTQVWNYNDSKDIDSIQLVMETGNIKINSISFATSSAFDAPDVSMTFSSQMADGDGDSVADDFTVDLQGAPASAPPVYSYAPTDGADVFNVQYATPTNYNIAAGFSDDDYIYGGSVPPVFVGISYDAGTGDTTVKIGASAASCSTVIVNDYELDPSQLRFDAAPIVIDLGPSGIEYVAASQGAEIELSGYAFAMAWLGSNDGLLVYDCNQDGVIAELREYVFTLWAPGAQTDMQALALVFDTNHDGMLDGQDDSWNDFGIWQDLNSDGVQQSGEFNDLASWGVESIALDYSAASEAYAAAGGDVQVYGQMTVTYADGSTGVAEDVAFAVQGIEPASGALDGGHALAAVDQDVFTAEAETGSSDLSPTTDLITGGEEGSLLACSFLAEMVRDTLIDPGAIRELLPDARALAASIQEAISQDAWCVGFAAAYTALGGQGVITSVGDDSADRNCGFDRMRNDWSASLHSATSPLLI